MPNRIMGIDYGERKIGIAISDPLKIISYPYQTIDRKVTPDYIIEIKKIIEQKKIESIVVGYPITLSGNESQQTKVTLKFINELKDKLEINIYKCDERLTSKEAEYYLRQKGLKPSKNKDKIDQLSASIILTQFLASKNNEII